MQIYFYIVSSSSKAEELFILIQSMLDIAAKVTLCNSFKILLTGGTKRPQSTVSASANPFGLLCSHDAVFWRCQHEGKGQKFSWWNKLGCGCTANLSHCDHCGRALLQKQQQADESPWAGPHLTFSMWESCQLFLGFPYTITWLSGKDTDDVTVTVWWEYKSTCRNDEGHIALSF